ncbi:cytochrome P450 67 [Colletotrichum sp. SAR 10_86]|nr:cytochrome P450 67 [Colletotrichum sp. SAR 10_65]KAI8218164.1 cytochrome P450 67 [Colletotrichum sp. SAR 10_86]KAJ5007399.1 cytochrome P450 67 [Colletotrichum sp. SAR 10_66]
MRVTPPEGLMYVIGRSEAVYENAEDFVPERWYSKPEMIRERAGYAPFSTDTVEDCMSWRLGQLNLCFTDIEGV